MRESRSGIKSSEAVWLVKSGDRILGPFSIDDIAAKLRQKEFVLIDELALPKSRWRVIRDEPALQAVIEEVRKNQISGREDTELQSLTSVTLTEVTDEYVRTEAPPTGPVEIPAAHENSRIVDAEFTEERRVPAVNEPRIAGPAKKDRDLPQYGVSGTRSERKGGLSAAMWTVAGLVFVVALILYLRSQNSAGPESPRANSGGLSLAATLSEGDRMWRQGELQTALKLYRSANGMKPKDPEIVSRLAPLMIQLEGQTVQAKRLLQDSIAQLPPSGENGIRSEMEMGLGLAALAAEDFTEAEARFRAALVAVQTSYPAIFNSGLTQYLARAYSEATKRFTSAGDEAAALMMIARTGFASDFRAKGSKREAQLALDKIIEGQQDFRLEALVLSAVLDLQSDNKKAAAAKVRSVLDLDPDLTRDHWHDPFLNLSALSWKLLIPYCRNLNDQLKSVSSRALYSLCLFKGERREEANEILSEALSKSPEDGLLQSVAAYILISSERFEEARAALKLAARPNAPRMSYILRGHLCERDRDDACADQSWKELMSELPPSLPALVGAAKLKIKAGDRAGAQILLERARILSSRYRPLLRVLASLQAGSTDKSATK